MSNGQSQNSQARKSECKDRSMPCKFYQKDTCSHTKDHETNGQLYLHVCNVCSAQDKSLTHTTASCGLVKKTGKALPEGSA